MCKKRVTSLLLAAVLAFMSVMSVHAEENENTVEEEVITVEDANETLDSYDDEETEWETIYIDSVDDLKKFSRNCWLDTWSQNKKVYLQEDLDLTGSDFVSIPTFGGYFDGQGHTIKGLSIRDSVSYTGLFCYTQKTAVIANLKVNGVVRPSGKQIVVGGIVGNNSGILLDCRFEGIVEGNDYVGGVVGFNELSGILIDCACSGTVMGAHYTGGIVGDNMGNIVGCVNESDVNTSNADRVRSLEDINIEQYTSGLLESGEGSADEKKESINNNTIDSGGIAGLSTGIIQFCANKGTVGYEHVGYNMGGIVGRQSGYVYACENSGTVYGRKDVGGIAGQTEPYIAIDLTKDIAYQLSENIDKMHDLTSIMLDDAGAESDTISGRISIIQDFAGKALDDTSFLADKSIEWTDGMVGSVNDAINRLDFVMDETAKENGVLDQARDAAGNVREAAGELEDTVEALDIYQYMSPEEQQRYDSAKSAIENGSKEQAGYYDNAMKGYYNFYVNIARQFQDSYVDDLRPKVNGIVDESLINVTDPDDFAQFIYVDEWVHCDVTSGEILDEFPSSDDSRRADDQAVLDKTADLMSENAEQIAEGASDYAEKQYRNVHGASYSSDMRDNLQTMSDIALACESELTENVASELKDAVGYTKGAAGNLENAGNEAKNIFSSLSDMPDISMPQLGEEYRSKTNSLTSNLKGLSENMGYLNDEMSSSNDVLLSDMEDLNDQFSTIMRLYTDAIDGVLDMDYSHIYEDNSQEDAETSTEATIADCKNSGEVRADINVSGIVGTMAIEYDFDLESDVTGIEDAKLNSTFLTKCVLRSNINSGKITAQKSYAGGISGLQEMGTILWCENYGKITSSSGSYVGGITGESRSYITNSYAKCSVSGDEYVAGIAGYGSSISNCCAIVRMKDAAAFFGAIAGETDKGGIVEHNYFVSDEIAGIDRISYSGRAEPVSYKDMLEIEGLPDKFRMMTITFYADEEEVKTVECPYGGTVAESQYPEIPTKQGFYADWDIKELRNVTYDEDVTVEYVRYLTTLGSEQTRPGAQSVLLADGMFRQEESIEVTALDIAEDMPLEVVEHWRISIPEDGSEAHQIRYQAPQGQTEGVSIHVKQGGEWVQTDTGLLGVYYLLNAQGNNVELAICIHEKNFADYLIYIIPAVAALIVVVVLLIRSIRKKKKVKKQMAAEAVAENTQESV
ncbi:hypothetical protein [Parablautia muri]|uniref:GLUG domain-containing protein n=1 Tax=Parablautia muri TaxID=2320879 RepID=A0A9X5BJA6_9FIRM|nr:hypothetical protein [Parablautia muri]NBJ95101.1 hypothetical protein [Parablautia muri]